MVLLFLLQEGWTALFFACKHRHTKIMRLLLERGADFLRTDIYGQYVMQLANTMDFDTKRVMEDYILRTVSISSESSYGSSMTSSREDDKRSLSLDLANEDTFMIMAPAVGVIVPTIKGAIQIPIPIVSASASTQPTVNSIVESVANEVERIKVEFEELGGYEDDIEDNTDSLSIGERSEGETVDGEDFDLQSSS